MDDDIMVYLDERKNKYNKSMMKLNVQFIIFFMNRKR